jgi:hypothetical protein
MIQGRLKPERWYLVEGKGIIRQRLLAEALILRIQTHSNERLTEHNLIECIKTLIETIPTDPPEAF